MTISFVGVASANTGLLGAGGLTVSAPGGVIAGDRMFACANIEAEAQAITTPPGWTLLTPPVNTSDHEVRFYTRVAVNAPGVGLEPATHFFDYSGTTVGTGGIVAFRNVASFTLDNLADGLTLLAHPTPSIALAQAGGWLFGVWSAQSLLALGWTPPGTMTERWDQTSGLVLAINATSMGATQGPLAAGSYSRSATSLNLIAAINTIFALEAAVAVGVGQATETDTALMITVNLSSEVTPGDELDTALEILASARAPITPVSESDTADALAASFSVPIDRGIETDTASALTPQVHIPVGLAMELDSTDTFMALYTAVIELAEETDFAFPLLVAVAGQAGIAVEIDDAFDIIASLTSIIFDTGEMDVAFPIAVGNMMDIGVAIEQDFAFTEPFPIAAPPLPLEPDDFYSPGPCVSYEPIIMCTLDAASVAVSGYAIQAASEILYYATAQRFDTCQVTIRPCRKVCPGTYWPPLGTGWWELGSSYPQPALINGLWYNLGCGTCGENCSCTTVSEVILPGPVQRIVQVTVDGVVLTEGVDYRLDDYRKLVRLGDVWPFCNDLNKEITEVDTWSVTAIYGEPLPTLGRIAAGELMCDIISDLVGGDCSLPSNLTELSRQGVTMSFQDAKEALESGFESLKYVDKFIQRYNPNGLMARPYMYDLDSPTFRVTGTTIK